MSWRFRKIFRLGPFRTTWSKRGWGFSWGIPGLRFGVSPDGRRYISVGIPRTGFYWIKYLDRSPSKTPSNQSTQSTPTPNSQSKQTQQPWWKQKGLKDS